MIWPSFLLRFEKVADLLTLPGLLGHAPRKSRVDDRVARVGGINSSEVIVFTSPESISVDPSVGTSLRHHENGDAHQF